ncbi:MAG: hypothetical protein MOB07_24935 [Acidobacteria bacterium]|nr:hypothetical protein [Acidobacteriota bacterium]
MNEYEKLRIANFYYGYVTGDIHKRIETLNVLKQTYPPVWSVLGGLAANYNQIGRLDQAIAQASETIRLNPNFSLPRLALGSSMLRLNRYAEAREVFEQALKQRIELTAFDLTTRRSRRCTRSRISDRRARRRWPEMWREAAKLGKISLPHGRTPTPICRF